MFRGQYCECLARSVPLTALAGAKSAALGIVIATMLAGTTTAAQAQSGPDSCQDISQLLSVIVTDDNAVNGTDPASSIPLNGILLADDEVVFNVNAIGSPTNVSVYYGGLNSAPLPTATLIGGIAGSGSITFEATESGEQIFLFQVDAGSGVNDTAQATFSASCSDGSGGGSTPPTSTPSTSDEKKEITDDGVETLDQGRMSTSPNDLPGSTESRQADLLELDDLRDLDAQRLWDDIDRLLDEIETRRQRVNDYNQLIENLEQSLREARQQTNGTFSGDQSGGATGAGIASLLFPEQFAEANPDTQLSDLRESRDAELNAIAVLRFEIDEKKRDLTRLGFDDQRPGDNRQAGSANQQATGNFGEFGDGDISLYAPINSPVSAAFDAIATLDGTIEANAQRRVGMLDLWSKLQASVVQGPGGFNGITASGQAGLVSQVAPGLDVGAFLSGFGGRVDTTVTSSAITSAGAGLGAYLKYAFTPHLMGGVSVAMERSTNLINTGGDTGTFLRDLLTLDASLSGQHHLAEFTFSPNVNLNVSHSNRHAYTDSNSDFIAAEVSTNADLSAGMNIGRTFFSVENLFAITPRIGGGINADLTGGGISGFALAGIAFDLDGGATMDLSANVTGIGDSASAVNVSASLRAPLN